MKTYLLIFVLVGLLIGGCTAPDPRAKQAVQQSGKATSEPNSPLPLCQIEAIESCDVETVGTSETIYRCPKCKADVACPDCAKKGCEDCTGETCRCRLRNPPSPETESAK
jgi:hypothetical protein